MQASCTKVLKCTMLAHVRLKFMMSGRVHSASCHSTKASGGSCGCSMLLVFTEEVKVIVSALSRFQACHRQPFHHLELVAHASMLISLKLMHVQLHAAKRDMLTLSENIIVFTFFLFTCF